MGLLLYILSLVLSAVLLPAGFIYGFIKQIYKRQFFRSFNTMNTKLYQMAASIDRYGNIVCAELFNATLISKASTFRFGDGHETVSSVIGRNVQTGTLTVIGKALNTFLCRLDKDHSIKNIGY
jgi:hypothetical protein